MATVRAEQDVLVEGNETVVLDITGVVNGTENGTQQQTITIIDDDEPPLPSVSLSVSPAEISENGGISTIMATLSTNHDEMVTVNLSVTGTATGGSDYVLGSQSIIIPAGDTTGSTVVYAINDDIDESKVFQESFSWSNWRSGEPNNFGTGEDYAMMIDREWNDISVNDGGINKYFILEVNKNIEYLQSNDPNQSYDYLGQYEGHSYFKSTEKVSSWIEARDQAYDDGGYLVTITSSEESDFINSYPDLSSTHVFIGLYQDKNGLDYFEPSGGWKWVTSEVNYETVVVEITDVTNAIEKGFQKEIIKIFEVLDNFNDNNAPTIEDQNFSIKENSSIGAVVGVLVASDKDNDTLTFTITAGTGQGTFDLDNFGTIIVKDSTKLDFELNNSLNLNVKVSDGLADATADVVINITDVDENTITGLENSILQVENVFPIPAKKKLKVIIKDNVEIKKLEFIDFSGITTAPKNIKRKDNQLIMDVTNLSSGIYILNIVSENKSKKIRIVISR